MFVGNQLNEIKENSEINEWRWVPTKENPADDGTRFSPDALKAGIRWFLGPSSLYKPESQWPKENSREKFVNDNSEYVEKVETIAIVIEKSEHIIDPSRFSSWNVLRGVIFKVFKAINFMKRAGRTSMELNLQAEQYLFKCS